MPLVGKDVRESACATMPEHQANTSSHIQGKKKKEKELVFVGFSLQTGHLKSPHS